MLKSLFVILPAYAAGVLSYFGVWLYNLELYGALAFLVLTIVSLLAFAYSKSRLVRFDAVVEYQNKRLAQLLAEQEDLFAQIRQQVQRPRD